LSRFAGLDNLTWIHPLLFEKDAELTELGTRSASGTESESKRLLDKQLADPERIIPLHREFRQRPVD